MKQTTQPTARRYRCCFFSYDNDNNLNNTNNEQEKTHTNRSN